MFLSFLKIKLLKDLPLWVDYILSRIFYCLLKGFLASAIRIKN